MKHRYVSLAWVRARMPEVSPNTLRGYLSETMANGEIQSAGRGWYNMNDNDLQELVARQKKYPFAAMINSILVGGQVDLTKLSEEQIAHWEADLLARRNANKQQRTPSEQL